MQIISGFQMASAPCEPMVKPGFMGALKHLYFTYTINSGLYMLELWEVWLFNSIVIFMLMMSMYTFCVYFPPYVIEIMMHIWVLTQDENEKN